MRARAFWKAVTLDRTDFLDRLIALLTEHDIRFCVVGGQAVTQQLDAALPRGVGQAGLGADDRLLQEAPRLRPRAATSSG
jgi:hypothetical protein